MTIRALDGLRGLAVLLVLLSHMSLHNINLIAALDFSGIGKAGVYLFFALSAFLLTWQAIEVGDQARHSGRYWLGYGIRRVLRIYPLYIVVLVISLALFQAGFGLNPKITSLEHVIRHLALMDGEHIYWAIPVEFKYYLLLPLVCLLLTWSSKVHSRAPVIITAAAVAGVTWLWPPAASANNDVSLGPYLSIFLLGSLGAVVAPLIPVRKIPAEIAGWLCLGLALMTIPALWRFIADANAPNNVFHREFIFYGLIWTACILAGLNANRFTTVLETPVLRFLGRISFSVYLWHYLIVQLIDRHLPMDATLQFLLVMAVTLGLSWTSYRLIERPFINWGHRTTNHWNKPEDAA